MGRKKKTDEEKRETNRKRQKRYYDQNKEKILKRQMERYYEKRGNSKDS